MGVFGHMLDFRKCEDNMDVANLDLIFRIFFY